jgi:hypothetical protein
MLREGHEEMMDKIEDMEEQAMNFDFKDEYLKKAMEHGFFSKDGFERLKENVHLIMGSIDSHLPVLFTRPK